MSLWKTREERLSCIALHYAKQSKLHVVTEQMKRDPEWDIRGTVFCLKCEHYIDEFFRKYAECPCKELSK